MAREVEPGSASSQPKALGKLGTLERFCNLNSKGCWWKDIIMSAYPVYKTQAMCKVVWCILSQRQIFVKISRGFTNTAITTACVCTCIQKGCSDSMLIVSHFHYTALGKTGDEILQRQKKWQRTRRRRGVGKENILFLQKGVTWREELKSRNTQIKHWRVTNVEHRATCMVN